MFEITALGRATATPTQCTSCDMVFSVPAAYGAALASALLTWFLCGVDDYGLTLRLLEKLSAAPLSPLGGSRLIA